MEAASPDAPVFFVSQPEKLSMLTTRYPLQRPLRNCTSLTLAFLLTCLSCATTDAVDRYWNRSTHGWWGDAANWSPNGVPASTDTVYLGNLASAENTSVSMNQNDIVSGVHITDGMTLSPNGHTLTVLGDTTISGLNIESVGNSTTYHHSRVYVERGVGPDDFDTDNLTILDEGRLRMVGGIVEVDAQILVDDSSDVIGHGILRFPNAGTAYVNNGTLEAAPAGLFLQVLGGAQLDLDGTTGNGRIILEDFQDQLTINGGTLADPFDGEIMVDHGASLAMNLAQPWSTGPGSQFTLGRGNNGVQPDLATVSGADVSIGGNLQLTYGTNGRFTSGVTFQHSSSTDVSGNSNLRLDGTTFVDGGQFMLEENASIDFNAATTVNGGEFTTHSMLSTTAP